ncbi:response regulator [Geomonas paludis]|uniref:histidine kinase n=1 Tax=Geomonas paludis TaxID=2740185 RepID=A0A6V8N080_9BACT|nr:hybrid sensor histidine kinase/response regulator [Geomonas paludis]UPU36578.1 response regulator [Geomonas paludis]GFO65832.1 hybrid sensor histidine kinase/response regulator [Geomonas paludis]
MLELTANHTQELLQDRDKKTILIVDDEGVIRDLCRRVLNDYHIVEAGDGQEAYEIFLRGGIDVILTDVMMPRMDGIELLKKLKEREPTMVVIIMTGFADKDLILKALKADADDFITKPLNLLQLKSAISKALVKKALKEEIANLRNLDRFKTVFLSLISHKFRTPITSISLFLQNLAAGVIDPADEGAKEHINLIYNEACYLGNLVTDLLTFSSVMDSGAGLHLEPCTLNLLLPKLLQEAQDVAARPGVTTHVTLDTVPELMLDRDKVSFAVRQVIDNAIKFSKETGVVCVTLRNLENQCEITVQDDGIGISPEQLPKLFEKFYQVDADHTGQVRGFGLGLFYVREFIRMHGGTVSIDSEENVGTRVVITLPNKASQSP